MPTSKPQPKDKENPDEKKNPNDKQDTVESTATKIFKAVGQYSIRLLTSIKQGNINYSSKFVPC